MVKDLSAAAFGHVINLRANTQAFAQVWQASRYWHLVVEPVVIASALVRRRHNFAYPD